MRISILLAFLLFTPIACAQSDIDKAPAGEEQKANAIKATVGEEFMITLAANATTGYEWQIANKIDERLISFVNAEYIHDKIGLIGSGGKSVWIFKAVQAGETRISFKYIRPWEKDTPPVNEATYTIDIQK